MPTNMTIKMKNDDNDDKSKEMLGLAKKSKPQNSGSIDYFFMHLSCSISQLNWIQDPR